MEVACIYTHNTVIRDSDYIARLRAFVHKEYQIHADAITPAKRGYYGETWRLTAKGRAYFVKLDYLSRHQALLQNSLPVVQYLCDHGIDFINRIVKTCNGALSAFFETAVVGVFEWIDGVNVDNNDTKVFEYPMLCKVYPLTKPGFAIPTVRFSDDMATRSYEKWNRLKNTPGSTTCDTVLSVLEQHHAFFANCAARLNRFATFCQTNPSDLYFTHGDAGGNFLMGKEQNYFVDWDEMMYAPLERDLWVMGCHGWARELFADTLRENNINYTIRLERLAFYCYHMFFLYLGEFLDDFAVHGESERIEVYFNDGWIMERVAFADTIEYSQPT